MDRYLANADEILAPNDYKERAIQQYDPQWKNVSIAAVKSQQGFTPEQRALAIARIQNSAPRVYQQAEDRRISDFLISKAHAFSPGLKNIIRSIIPGIQIEGAQEFNGQINPDLVFCFKKGFVQRETKNNGIKVYISLANMLKPNPGVASSYDTGVLRKAKRIVRIIKSQISAQNLQANVTLSKAYQKMRGAYLTNRVTDDPAYKIQLIKGIAKKIGAPYSITNYRNKMIPRIQKMKDNINKIAANTMAGKNFVTSLQQVDPETASEFRQAFIKQFNRPQRKYDPVNYEQNDELYNANIPFQNPENWNKQNIKDYRLRMNQQNERPVLNYFRPVQNNQLAQQNVIPEQDIEFSNNNLPLAGRQNE